MNRIELFNRLITILESSQLNYALVGVTDNYPEEIGSDIDIMIYNYEIEKFHRIIWKLEKYGMKAVQMLQHETVAFYYIFFYTTNEQILYIQPDVCTDFYNEGRLFLESSYLLKDTKYAEQEDGTLKNFKVLSPAKEFIYYFIKKIDKGYIQEFQFNHLRKCWLASPQECIDELNKIWDNKYVETIQNVFNANNMHQLSHDIPMLRHFMHSKKKKKSLDTINDIILKFSRILHPTGYTITFMGPDGSGKTTVINQFKKDIAPAFRKIQQFHLFPIEQKESIPNTNPQGKVPRGSFTSLLKLFYFVAIYLKGYVLKVFPSRIRSTLTIFDRYYDDILIDPRRYRNGISSFWVKRIGRLIPQPDIWIILDAPTSVIQSRKAEVSTEETERQRKAYIDFAQSKKNALLINTDKNVESISIEICQFVIEHLNKRTIRRYKNI